MNLQIITNSYFDGTRFHTLGPYRICVSQGRILTIARDTPEPWRDQPQNAEIIRVPFVMPGLVETHAHLFLIGEEVDFETRKTHLKADRQTMLDAARRNVAASIKHGITMIRDAGDLHGINHQIREEAPGPIIRSAGRAIRRPKGYGSFMALEADDTQLESVARELAQTADDFKILLTDIIDFEHGRMRGEPQFSPCQLKRLVAVAREYGLRTFAHCSGEAGLKLAVEAGVDSIEHGFFMTRSVLERMADRQIAWVPTFSPVYLQWARPNLAGWKPETRSRLWDILEHHFAHVARAFDLGVPVMAGSDAGSFGVPHGSGLLDELQLLKLAGLPLAAVLAAATSTPRLIWGTGHAQLKPDTPADLLALGNSPLADFEALRDVQLVMREHILYRAPEHAATA